MKAQRVAWAVGPLEQSLHGIINQMIMRGFAESLETRYFCEEREAGRRHGLSKALEVGKKLLAEAKPLHLLSPAWQGLLNDLPLLCPSPLSSARNQGASLGLVTAASKEVLGGQAFHCRSSGIFYKPSLTKLSSCQAGEWLAPGVGGPLSKQGT